MTFSCCTCRLPSSVAAITRCLPGCCLAIPSSGDVCPDSDSSHEVSSSEPRPAASRAAGFPANTGGGVAAGVTGSLAGSFGAAPPRRTPRDDVCRNVASAMGSPIGLTSSCCSACFRNSLFSSAAVCVVCVCVCVCVLILISDELSSHFSFLIFKGTLFHTVILVNLPGEHLLPLRLELSDLLRKNPSNRLII